MFKKFLGWAFGALLAASLGSAAIAQSNPGLSYDQVPTAGQWNSYFSAKQDVLGYVPLPVTGGTMTGRLVTASSSANLSGFNITPGSVPAAPANGDMWMTTAGLFVRVNGATIGPLGTAACPTCAVTNATNTFTAAQRINLNATSLPTAQTGALLQIGQADATSNRIELDSFGAASFFSGLRADGTNASPTALAANDEIVSINAWGYDGVARLGPASAVRQYAAGAWSGTNHATYVDIATTAIGSVTMTSRMRVENDGGITVGGATTQGAGTLNLLNGLYNNGVAPTGTGGYARATAPTISSPVFTTAFTATGLVGLTNLASQSANTILAAATAGSPVAMAAPSCSGAANALQWLTGTGLQCGTITASASSITVGTTTVTGGAGMLYNASSGATLSAAAAVNNGVLTFSGAGVPTASTTLPNGLAMGTPASLNLSNATALPVGSITGLGAGVATFLATPSSANLSTAVTDETGTGVLVFGTSPTIATPVITGGTINALTAFSLRDTSAAFNVTLAAVSSTTLTAGRTVTLDVVNGARTFKLGANLTILTDPGGITGALKSNGSGTFAQAACADLSNGATGCSTATGTSGATIPLLNGTNTWSGVQSFTDNDLALLGSSSGNLILRAAAVSASSVVRFPAGSTDFSATGGANQFVKQSSAGAALTVAAILAADLPVATTSTVGGVIVDGTTITISGGIITASGASATAITPGTTTIGGGSAVSGYALTNSSGTLANNQLFSTGGGFINKFRNASFDTWQRGTSVTSASSGAYTADGFQVYYTGGTQIVASKQTNTVAGFPRSYMQIVGSTSNTNINIRQRIESFIAAPLAGATVTVSFRMMQNSGSTITPKIQSCYASAQDNFGTCTADLASTSLSACATTVWCTQSYTFAASANATNGYEVTFDCNTGFTAATACNITATDIRVTPGVATGINANPPLPELRPIPVELAINQRYVYMIGGVSGDTLGTGDVFGTGICRVNFMYKVTPRVPFTAFTVANLSNFSVISGSVVNGPATALTYSGGGLTGAQMNANIAGLTNANACFVATTNANATGLFTGAEL